MERSCGWFSGRNSESPYVVCYEAQGGVILDLRLRIEGKRNLNRRQQGTERGRGTTEHSENTEGNSNRDFGIGGAGAGWVETVAADGKDGSNGMYGTEPILDSGLRC